MLSRVLVFKVNRLVGDHVDGSRLGLLGRRRVRRRGDVTLLGPSFRIFLRSLELATQLQAYSSSWRHRDGCICQREPGILLVTPDESPITHLVLRSLGLELFATRHTGFSDKLLDHVDRWSEVTNMLG